MSDAAVAQHKSSLARTITASSAGTLIEWYDFYIFGSLATVMATHFFPGDASGLLKTLGVYATGFVVRPIGAIFFGRIGDLIGRKYTFLMTLVLMGGSTFFIGLLPTYDTIGVLAPIVLIVLRLCQGLALGGEYGGAAIYVAENSPDARRGFFTSFIQTTASAGLFVSLAVVLSTRLALGEESFQEWGWRVPFLVSILLVVVSYYIRRRLAESPMFAQMKAAGLQSQSPVRDTFGNGPNMRRVILTLFGAAAGQGVIFYTSQYYALLFLQSTLKLPLITSTIVVAGGVLLATPFFVVFGSLSDRIGRKPIMMTATLLAAVLYYPLFRGLAAFRDSIPAMIAIMFVLVLLVCMIYGPIAAYLVESFPTRIRYTSMSFPYHIGNGVFGGLTPLIAENCVRMATTSETPWVQQNAVYMGLVYPCAMCLTTFVIGMAFMTETRGAKMAGEVVAE